MFKCEHYLSHLGANQPNANVSNCPLPEVLEG